MRIDDDDEKDAMASNVVGIKDGKVEGRVYETTLTFNKNQRRYGESKCQHKGPYIVDAALQHVECGDCGAFLNPMFVLEILAHREAYWNMRQRDLTKYLDELNKEIEGRQRTRCTHCGNMTPIKFAKEMPRTWVPTPY